MALLKIHTFPDPVLKKKAEPVVDFNPELEQITQDMLETMYDAPGVGLAANQVGLLKQIVVVDVDYNIEGDEDDAEDRRYTQKNPKIFINPQIEGRDGAIKFKEGCLSVPGFTEEVDRSATVRLKYQDLKGEVHELDADGLLAVVIQHEIDHLEGHLFIDRLSTVKKEKIKNKIKKERTPHFERSKFHVEL